MRHFLCVLSYFVKFLVCMLLGFFGAASIYCMVSFIAMLMGYEINEGIAVIGASITISVSFLGIVAAGIWAFTYDC